MPKGSYRNARRQGEIPPAFDRAAAFEVRQRRAGWIVREGKAGLARALMTPDFAAVSALFAGPIKTAPSAGNIHSIRRGAPATLAMAQALASQCLLPRKQIQKCLQFIHQMILF